MKFFVTSDNHFNHENIIKYCKRPFSSVEEMNRVMITKWNEKIGKEDIVFHLGDFSFGSIEKIKEVREKLNGIIILLLGNHESYKKMRNRGFILIRSPICIGNFILTHKPLPKNEIPEGFINVHGHIHEKESLYGINVSVDKTDFYPVELNELEKKR